MYMNKKLEELTEEDIKQIARDAGVIVSWQNAKDKIGLMILYSEEDFSKSEMFDGDTKHENLVFEVGSITAPSIEDIQKLFESMAKTKYVFKYYKHYMLGEQLRIECACVDGTMMRLPEITHQQLFNISSRIDLGVANLSEKYIFNTSQQYYDLDDFRVRCNLKFTWETTENRFSGVTEHIYKFFGQTYGIHENKEGEWIIQRYYDIVPASFHIGKTESLEKAKKIVERSVVCQLQNCLIEEKNG